jgi:hypothetical protein
MHIIPSQQAFFGKTKARLPPCKSEAARKKWQSAGDKTPALAMP